MSKKSFKGTNPALQYISSLDVSTDIPHDQHNTDEDHNTDNAHDNHYTYYDDSIHSTDNTDKTDTTHKAYKKPPAEVKSKRLNLLLQPSTLENMSKIARMRQTSVNDLINRVLRDYAEREAATISRYDEVFGEPAGEIR